ncbi:hypothetical protein [Pseudoalteromonas aurantia]|uniref:Uncharacterized protein n=1 Tax=Pseudoalteromonas aurantia 208 TaxID=1314867 RepID=A0ABR9EH93_9GAMM|nr:hypothetical protein [Pseudoalteromonas aurantia]MBE0370360.1 hypothetical protein [Pseudoalteromonas aurantia 208]
MKYLIAPLIAPLIALMTPSMALAASTVSQLTVEGEVATFTLSEPKTHTVPSCVTAERTNQWAINLSSLQGQAMYSLLVTAVSKEQLVSVHSTMRCESLAGVEQAARILLSINQSSNGRHDGAWLYKGDGFTKVGKVISGDSGWYQYAPIGGTIKMHLYRPEIVENNNGFSYLDAECKGDPYLDYHGYEYLKFVKPVNHYLTYSDSTIKGNRLADHGHVHFYRGDTNGGCTKETRSLAYQSTRAVKLEKTEHPLCGSTPCWIK